MEMTSYRGYLIRALNDWILDNGCTPYILVNAMLPDVDVPDRYVKDGQIVLNISPTAVHALQVTDDMLSFSARFGGVPTEVFVPVPAVMGIYARENGQGMVFETVIPGGTVSAGDGPRADSRHDRDEETDSARPESSQSATKDGHNEDDSPDKPPRGGRRPNLRVVK